jgi:Flp pilus assembly protein TadG
MRNARTTLRCRSRGAAIVEFALILPFLSMMSLGMITAGIALDRKQEITNASREAARFGATVDENQCADPILDCSGFNWAQLVQAVAVERSNGAVTAAGVCVALVEGPGYAPLAIDSSHIVGQAVGQSYCFVDNSTDEGKRVQVKITRADKLQAVVFNMNLNVGSRALARFEQ